MKIDFEFTTQYGVFRDALYLDDDHQLTTAEIDALKQERLDNWLTLVETPQASPNTNVEIDGITYEVIQVDGQLVLNPIA